MVFRYNYKCGNACLVTPSEKYKNRRRIVNKCSGQRAVKQLTQTNKLFLKSLGFTLL